MRLYRLCKSVYHCDLLNQIEVVKPINQLINEQAIIHKHTHLHLHCFADQCSGEVSLIHRHRGG